mgnify:CR=1 FL=1
MQKTLAIQQADTKPKIGVDFHGVINTKPDFFREFCREALKIGLEVYIISGGPRETILAYLNQYQIPYTKLWCIFDYYEQRHQVEFYDDGSFRIDDELWNKAKAEYCKEHNICIHIDDSVIYGREFATPYCRYDEKANSCVLNGKQIYLANPAQALSQILALCRQK